MIRPLPKLSINVEAANPYTEFDRGLFVIPAGDNSKYARVHKAVWKSYGTNSSLSTLDFQLMYYDNYPQSAAELMEGTLLSALGGNDWFDTFVRGPVPTPILAEYWAIRAYMNYYAKDGAAPPLTDEERNKAASQAKQTAGIIGAVRGITAVEAEIQFDTDGTGPMQRTSASMIVRYTREDQELEFTVSVLPETPFDPVHLALAEIRNLQA